MAKQSSENQPAEVPIALNEVKGYTPSDPTPRRSKLHSQLVPETSFTLVNSKR